MKILKSLVSYIQNLQNAKFYSCKLKLVYSMLKKCRDIMAWASKKPVIYNTIIKISAQYLLKLCLLGQKNTRTLF